MKWRVVAVAVVAACSTGCEAGDPAEVTPVGTPNVVLISPASSADDPGAPLHVTDSTRAVARTAEPGSSLHSSAATAIQAATSPRPVLDISFADPPAQTVAISRAASPDGQLVAVAYRRPDVPDDVSAETATTLIVYDVKTGAEVGATTTRTWNGTIDLEWSPSSQWLFMTQDESHVIGFRPEQVQRSLRQINVPSADDFAIVGSLPE